MREGGEGAGREGKEALSGREREREDEKSKLPSIHDKRPRTRACWIVCVYFYFLLTFTSSPSILTPSELSTQTTTAK